MKYPANFAELRAQWALKHTPSQHDIEYAQLQDQQANPHNEPYLNKRPRRSVAQITSDLCYGFADAVLGQQYGWEYENWLQSAHKDVWGTYHAK